MNPDRFQAALEPIEYEIELRKSRGFEATPLSDIQLQVIYEALTLGASGQVLPMLPDGWRYTHIAEFTRKAGFICSIREPGKRFQYDGEGPTPYAAAQKAIENIKEKDNG